jgi:predicted dehydrogenase
MRFLNRRQFLQDSAALAAAMAAGGSLPMPAAAPEGKRDVNDQLRVAVVGVRSRGKDHVKGFAGKHNCVVTTICDCDEAVIGPAMKIVTDAQKREAKYVQDIRKVVADPEIDIISIATPNHWHALAAIWAMQNGKDVYVEKPVSHNVSEGRRVVEAARKYNKMCQAGTQSRTMAGMRETIEFLQAGKLGKIKVARGICYKLRGSIGKVKGEQPIPKSIDYDLWCGPAPKKPLMREKLHYDWHWIWDYGNGDLGNQGIHEMDKARWGLGKAGLPKSVLSVGGRFGYVDDGETANTQICVFDYGDAELIFEVRGLPCDDPFLTKEGKNSGNKGKNFVGNIFYGSEGIMICPNYSSGYALDKDGKLIKEFKGDGDHFGNFVKAVRSRKVSDLNGDIEEGHVSSALCHLGNLSYQLGKMETFDKPTKAFGDDKEAVETLGRMEEHLKDHKVPLDKTPYRLGRKLTVDAKTETFVSDKEANALLTREYRKGFEVPAKL